MSLLTLSAVAKIALVATLISTTPLLVRAAGADPAPAKPAPRLQRVANTIAYSGEVLMRVRTDAGGVGAEQRADAIIERLRPILELSALRGSDITVKRSPMGGDAMILVRDLPLVTVDHELALANNTTDSMTLASQWAERLRQVLPQVSTNQ